MANLHADLQAYASLVDGLLARGLQLHARERVVALTLGMALGDAWQARGQTAAARQRWEQLVQLAMPATASGHPRLLHYLALAQLRLGQPCLAEPWMRRLEASAWRHPDWRELQRHWAEAAAADSAEASAVNPAGPSS
jgi:hypothetical protein